MTVQPYFTNKQNEQFETKTSYGEYEDTMKQ